ncbi:MAG: hypothetical protein WB217_12785 [Mesobacillus sp.]|uniref:hypothetical protein n=1 Tax=Mesobacillus sp. TaxID=2675271 RepID=UPI003C42708D
MKKPAAGLFHNSSAESEATGAEINRTGLLPNQNKKTVDKLAFIEFVYSLPPAKKCRGFGRQANLVQGNPAG